MIRMCKCQRDQNGLNYSKAAQQIRVAASFFLSTDTDRSLSFSNCFLLGVKEKIPGSDQTSIGFSSLFLKVTNEILWEARKQDRKAELSSIIFPASDIQVLPLIMETLFNCQA